MQGIISTGGFVTEFKYLESSYIWEEPYETKILFRKNSFGAESFVFQFVIQKFKD
jgi:hypothetical protein